MSLNANSTLSGSQASDYFGEEDPEFLEALNNIEIPEPTMACESESSEDPLPPPPTQAGLKRRHSLSSEEEDEAPDRHVVLSSIDESKEAAAYLNNHTYGASKFGGFGEYMSRKRAKLQIQNAELDGEDEGTEVKSTIFHGLQIYINGWTEPSVQDLRQLIVQHGGIYHAYLDKKSLVTHIITCSLTPVKVREFQHMKVARPEWLVDSVSRGVLLPWQDYIFKPDRRVDESQGQKSAQTSLFKGGFLAQSNKKVHSTAESSHNLTPPTPSEPSVDEASGVETPPPSQYRPLYLTDPASPEQAKRIPGYVAHTSNPNAQRAMADPAWRAQHTSVAPDFIEGYYKNSRLHHLSAWKAELKNLVAEASEKVENGSAIVGEGSSTGDGKEESPIEKVVRENMGGLKGWIGGSDGTTGNDVSMKDAQLVMRSPGKGKGKEKAKEQGRDNNRVIMHCDFDSFFVSAGLVDRPNLRGKPVVVCHSQGNQGGAASTSEIASASYEARKYGIKGGMSLQQARKLCPMVITIPYEFARYKKFSLQFYTILMGHADDLQAVSVDEALIEVTSSVRRIEAEIVQRGNDTLVLDPAKEFAEAIRAQVRKATGCEVSIGIAHNIMLARLASRKAKPAGSFHVLHSDISNFLAPLDIDDLHGFGYATRQKAEEKLKATNLGELARMSKAVLCDALGKGTGETLYKAIRGIDERKLESDKPRKSVSADINYGIRFETNEQAEGFIYQLAEEVSRRLNSIDSRGRSLTLKIMKRDPSAPREAPKFMGHGLCETFTKQVQLVAPGGRATSDDKIIGEHAWRLLKAFNFDPNELRGIGIQITKLEKSSVVPVVETGQALLPFKPAPKGILKKPKIDVKVAMQDDEIEIIEVPKAKKDDNSQADPLPSFSQVDMSVFEALPEELRKELEAEYKRRSITPNPFPDLGPEPSAFLEAAKPKVKFSVKGTTNVKRITRQLAPKGHSSLSAKTSAKLFAKREDKNKVASVKVSNAELKKLDIDPDVFAVLTPSLQQEQLVQARLMKANRGKGMAYGGPRKVLKPIPAPRVIDPHYVKFIPPPPPQANYGPPDGTLKRPGPNKGEKLHFSAKDDVQDVIETWVNSFILIPPHQKDVDFFAKFLVRCADGTQSKGSSLEKAIAILKWWLVLLRRNFGAWEDAEEDEDDEPPLMKDDGTYSKEAVGRIWWKAFQDVKGKMDVVARKKFGGCLSIR
ncbi:DNA polymerase type-Y family protein [Abortiporus biennis]